MKNFSQSLLLFAAVSLYSMVSYSQEVPSDAGVTAITKSATGLGVPNGSSTDANFLPWLKPTDDSSYGYSMDKPIEIGGFLEGRGNDWSAQYFSSLLGPNGEPTTFERVKSCCAFALADPKFVEDGLKVGFLDQYKVTIEGQEPVYLYVTLYTEGRISAPKGFTTRAKR